MVVDDGFDMVINFYGRIAHNAFNFIKFVFQFFYFAINVCLSHYRHHLLKLINVEKMLMVANLFKAFCLFSYWNFDVKILHEYVKFSFFNSFFLNIIKLHISTKVLSRIELVHFHESFLESVFFGQSSSSFFEFITSTSRTLTW